MMGKIFDSEGGYKDLEMWRGNEIECCSCGEKKIIIWNNNKYE